MNFNKELVIPFTLFITILTGAWKFGIQAERFEAMQVSVVELRAQMQSAQRDSANFDKRVSIVETAITNLSTTLSRVEGKLDRTLLGSPLPPTPTPLQIVDGNHR